jgi:alpha-ketoglutarate-dependent taurine dioxygenase
MSRMGRSTLVVEPLDAAFGAVVSGTDLPELRPDDVETIRDAWIEFGLLIFPGQFLTRSEQDDFARRFGDLEFTATALTNIGRDGTVRDPSHALVKSLAGNEGWHHDSTYMPVQAKGAVFTAEIIPTEGGATGFADMRAAYEALDEAGRSLVADLTARHSRRYSMERAGHHVSENETSAYALYGFDDAEPPVRPIVKIHPDTGRPNLVIGQHAFGVVGMGDEESTALLDELNERGCIPAHTYHHEWNVGDAILWDNRRLMHRATPHDPGEPRRMWHTRIAGDPATETALNYLVPT